MVKHLPLEFMIGGELMKPHACALQYFTEGQNVLALGKTTCPACEKNCFLLKSKISSIENRAAAI